MPISANRTALPVSALLLIPVVSGVSLSQSQGSQPEVPLLYAHTGQQGRMGALFQLN